LYYNPNYETHRFVLHTCLSTLQGGFRPFIRRFRQLIFEKKRFVREIRKTAVVPAIPANTQMVDLGQRMACLPEYL
jgi:hypothetical protein